MPQNNSVMECPTEIKEMLKVLYNLSSAETEVLYFLCDNEARASKIADEIGKDRSTVQRYLSTLRTAGLVERESITGDSKRGRYYVYEVSDKDKLKNKVRNRMDEWRDEKLEVLDEM